MQFDLDTSLLSGQIRTPCTGTPPNHPLAGKSNAERVFASLQVTWLEHVFEWSIPPKRFQIGNS